MFHFKLVITSIHAMEGASNVLTPYPCFVASVGISRGNCRFPLLPASTGEISKGGTHALSLQLASQEMAEPDFESLFAIWIFDNVPTAFTQNAVALYEEFFSLIDETIEQYQHSTAYPRNSWAFQSFLENLPFADKHLRRMAGQMPGDEATEMKLVRLPSNVNAIPTSDIERVVTVSFRKNGVIAYKLGGYCELKKL